MEQKIYYNRKKEIIKYLDDNNIIGNYNITNYFLITGKTKKECYEKYMSRILTSPPETQIYYEYIQKEQPVKLYFDIEIYKDNEYFEQETKILLELQQTLENYFNQYEMKKIVLSSHNEEKKSYHIIYDIQKDQKQYYFKNVQQLKQLYQDLKLNEYVGKKNDKKYNIIDSSVYREGLFRTIFSKKSLKDNRQLIYREELSSKKLNVSNIKDLTQTFVTNTVTNAGQHQNYIYIQQKEQKPQMNEQKTMQQSDQDQLKKYIEQQYEIENSKQIEIKIVNKTIIVSTLELYCQTIQDYHKSNHQYIVIDARGIRQKCHDEMCKEKTYKEITFSKIPQEQKQIIEKYIKNLIKEDTLIKTAIDECKEYIQQNSNETVQEIKFDEKNMTFTTPTNVLSTTYGKCKTCQFEHTFSPEGYCIRCKGCNLTFPREAIPISTSYPSLFTFWKSYTQLINNGTIIINNYITTQDESTDCDVILPPVIFEDQKITNLFSQTLDGHKITKLAELYKELYPDFIYSKNQWYNFDGNIWKQDEDNLLFKRKMLESVDYYKKIKDYYLQNESQQDQKQIKTTINSLVNKINKPNFKNDIITEAKLFYHNGDFFKLLNSKKHLIPFTNGVYDLIRQEYRQSTKQDYINLTVGYEYNKGIQNQEVNKFINQILPKQNIRDWVLKKMSECLNGDIPNTHFLMFIGDGANGKSQLLNLMKLTMGELAEKVEVSLLTRKRNNANEANTEKMKLLNKRFAFLSEPEDGEKINIGLLKELTGSEEIVARGLYQDSVSFVMETKLFLACNELPEIKGEDTALWRRIRVIDFPSRFVYEPKEPNEYKIDNTLPSRMREDATWRQTFMNILIGYYYKEVKEPEEVKIRTNEYRQDNNEFDQWMDENVQQSETEVLNLKDVLEQYFGKKVHSKVSSKYKKIITNFLNKKYQPKTKIEYEQSSYNGQKYYGWKQFKLI